MVNVSGIALALDELEISTATGVPILNSGTQLLVI
jgi:hypothetical protein